MKVKPSQIHYSFHIKFEFPFFSVYIVTLKFLQKMLLLQMNLVVNNYHLKPKVQLLHPLVPNFPRLKWTIFHLGIKQRKNFVVEILYMRNSHFRYRQQTMLLIFLNNLFFPTSLLENIWYNIKWKQIYFIVYILGLIIFFFYKLTIKMCFNVIIIRISSFINMFYRMVMVRRTQKSQVSFKTVKIYWNSI